MQAIRILGPSHESQIQLQYFRYQVKDELNILQNEQWNRLIENTDKLRNSRDFWLSIKRTIGKTTSTEIRYVKEIYDEQGKESIFKENWKKISDE